jgi:hypothetical protein
VVAAHRGGDLQGTGGRKADAVFREMPERRGRPGKNYSQLAGIKGIRTEDIAAKRKPIRAIARIERCLSSRARARWKDFKP